MLISTKHLKAAGCHVTVKAGGRPLNDDVIVEIQFEVGSPLPHEVHEAIIERVSPEFADALFEGLANKIHNLQILEKISKTERAAWLARNHGE